MYFGTDVERYHLILVQIPEIARNNQITLPPLIDQNDPLEKRRLRQILDHVKTQNTGSLPHY